MKYNNFSDIYLYNMLLYNYVCIYKMYICRNVFVYTDKQRIAQRRSGINKITIMLWFLQCNHFIYIKECNFLQQRIKIMEVNIKAFEFKLNHTM